MTVFAKSNILDVGLGTNYTSTLRHGWHRHWNHPFSTYAKCSEEITFLNPWCLNLRVCIRGIKNVSFPNNFAYVLNGWSHRKILEWETEIIRKSFEKLNSSKFSNMQIRVPEISKNVLKSLLVWKNPLMWSWR